MRGIARIGMTRRQILALHPFRPRYDRVTLRDRTQTRRGIVSRLERVIGYDRTNADRWGFDLFGAATEAAPTERVISMYLDGPVQTTAGVGIDSTQAEILRAYPSARCLSPGFRDVDHYVGACFLLRGGVKRGVVTVFVLDSLNVQTPPGQQPIGSFVGKAVIERCGLFFTHRDCRAARR
jgi:hypothetical protein